MNPKQTAFADQLKQWLNDNGWIPIDISNRDDPPYYDKSEKSFKINVDVFKNGVYQRFQYLRVCFADWTFGESMPIISLMPEHPWLKVEHKLPPGYEKICGGDVFVTLPDGEAILHNDINLNNKIIKALGRPYQKEFTIYIGLKLKRITDGALAEIIGEVDGGWLLKELDYQCLMITDSIQQCYDPLEID